MQFVLEPVSIVVGVVAFFVGLWLGMLLRSGAKRRAIRLDEQVNILAAERDTLRKEREALRVERDSLDQRLTPLAAEVDRLKRAEARRLETRELPSDTTRDARRLDVGDVPVVITADTRRLDGRDERRVDTAADVAGAPGGADDVRRLKGVGDRFAAALAQLGITGVGQIAAWSGADADVIDSQLGSFSGRIRTDRLVEQARLLHEGRTTEYETRFGAMGG